jgi:predicted helicase
MSKVLINQYYNNLDRAIQFGKSTNEQAVRSHFWYLLNDYAHKNYYEVIPEVTCMGTKGKKVQPDGIVKNLFGLDIGLWESKDEKDNIDEEIDAKHKKGYPFTNILFEDTQIAVLFQRGEEVKRAPVRDADKLDDIITQFISFKSETVYRFEDALEKFKADIPTIVETLRSRIDATRAKNDKFIAASDEFFELCKAEINPDITEADIREMMIQHILTSDIFNKVFDDPEFHRHNNIGRELEKLIDLLFTYTERKNLMGSIEHYYDAINSAAAGIADHHEKQKFLKVLYEQFYKVYNPKAADRLGVVFTPNEIVQFMVEGVDHLLFKHFQRTLADKDVEILDPATGTGTYITSIIDYIPNQHLDYKYQKEIHANEVAILPYYVANLNIEFTFKQKIGYYREFENICFVDTLDNTAALFLAGKGLDRGKQETFRGLTSENTERIRRQNTKKISVIIGNPPYNANQKNENENNKNREYPAIDRRIRDTYVKHSTAQKTKVYDMYARFYRWATDRLNNNGILAFITNRSFIDSRTFDGFRKCMEADFADCYIIDTKSDVRANPKIAGTTHNVFGIQTGVAIMFLVKKEKQTGQCRINYIAMEDEWRKEEKMEWLRHNKLADITFERITPDENGNWLNLADTDFGSLLPLVNGENTVFQRYAMGVVTARDEWVYDLNETELAKRIAFFIDHYNHLLSSKTTGFDEVIKWSDTLKKNFRGKRKIKYNKNKFVKAFYRPYNYRFFYAETLLNDRLTSNHKAIFGKAFNRRTSCIGLIGKDTVVPFTVLAFDAINDLNSLSNAAGGNKTFPLCFYSPSGEYVENITDWGLEQFQYHYEDKSIKKEDIFHYTYAVLHDPSYRKTYELNLKREFPRIPFYDDFGKTKKQTGMFDDMREPEALLAHKPKLKVRLRANKETGIIDIDELTFLTGIPKQAWEYKLGNRSALEWILDQYKEKKPKDPTIAEKFNTYRFADYKEKVIDLLKRVCTVSVKTMEIIEEMGKPYNGSAPPF